MFETKLFQLTSILVSKVQLLQNKSIQSQSDLDTSNYVATNEYKRQIQDLSIQLNEMHSKNDHWKHSHSAVSSENEKLLAKLQFYENKLQGIKTSSSIFENEWASINTKHTIIMKYLVLIFNAMELINKNTNKNGNITSQKLQQMSNSQLELQLQALHKITQQKMNNISDTSDLIGRYRQLQNDKKIVQEDKNNLEITLENLKSELSQMVESLESCQQENQNLILTNDRLTEKYQSIKQKYEHIKSKHLGSNQVDEFGLMDTMSRVATSVSEESQANNEQPSFANTSADEAVAMLNEYYQQHDTDKRQWIIAALKIGDYMNQVLKKHGIPAPAPRNINFTLNKPNDKISVILSLYILYKMYDHQLSITSETKTQYDRINNQLQHKNDQIRNLKHEVKIIKPNAQKINTYWQKQIYLSDKQIDKLKSQNQQLKVINSNFKSELLQLKRDSELKTQEMKKLRNRTVKLLRKK